MKKTKQRLHPSSSKWTGGNQIFKSKGPKEENVSSDFTKQARIADVGIEMPLGGLGGQSVCGFVLLVVGGFLCLLLCLLCAAHMPPVPRWGGMPPLALFGQVCPARTARFGSCEKVVRARVR